uniref:Uncharacterized protein n=1 Tax=Rhizophora mucronata TaxID=61149 RepID=A0A2P2J7E0_RHIMU
MIACIALHGIVHGSVSLDSFFRIDCLLARFLSAYCWLICFKCIGSLGHAEINGEANWCIGHRKLWYLSQSFVPTHLFNVKLKGIDKGIKVKPYLWFAS